MTTSQPAKPRAPRKPRTPVVAQPPAVSGTPGDASQAATGQQDTPERKPILVGDNIEAVQHDPAKRALLDEIRKKDQELCAQSEKVLDAARMNMAMGLPFIGGLAMQMRLVAVVDARVQTACTDQKTIWFNANFLTEIMKRKNGGDQAAFIVGHEVWHAAFNHGARRGTRDPHTFNVAADIEINRLLKAEFKDKSPPDACYGENILGKDWEAYKDKPAEDIYDWLLANKPQQPQQPKQGSGSGSGSGGQQSDQQGGQGQQDQQDQQDQNGQGSGSSPSQGKPGKKNGKGGGQGKSGQGQKAPPGGGRGSTSADRGPLADDHDFADPKKKGEDDPNWNPDGTPKLDPRFTPDMVDPNSPEAKDRQRQWHGRIAQRANACRRAGTMPGDLEGVVSQISKPKIDFREKLMRFMELEGTRDEADFAKIDRRRIVQGIIAPGRTGRKLTLNIGLDTSGSCFNEVGLFLGGIQTMVEQFPRYTLRIYQCDAEVAECETYSSVDRPFEATQFRVKGGGGTAFQPVIDAVSKDQRISIGNGGNPEPLIYFTDGAGDNPTKPEFPVYWVVLNKAPCSATFGDRIELDSSDLEREWE